MTDTALRVEGLGKRYRIGAAGQRVTTLREALIQLATAPARNLARLRSLTSFGDVNTANVLWALRDVSFELKHGEVLGIVGRNGAGKSTLLKILSRITAPTTGFAEMDGHVGSLLEVGTGFHPELTGRDNIYLNGSILGMDKPYIDSRFDDIVAFAGVERFINTPVKRYSSGMYVRLAFAVAAHLEPDILIVDEVLAVGDAEFQQKCLGRMGDVAREGRTVLFVSHNMNAIQRLCRRSILLDHGKVTSDGLTTEVIARYLEHTLIDTPPSTWIDLSDRRRTGSSAGHFTALRYSGLDQAVRHYPYPDGPLSIELKIHASAAHHRASIAVSLYDQYGTMLLNADVDNIGPGVTLPKGDSTWEIRIVRLHLRPGNYVLGLWLADRMGEAFDRIESAARIEVIDRQPEQLGVRIDPRYTGTVTCQFSVREMT